MKRLSTMAAALLVAGTISACNKAPDPGEQVRDALKTANIDDVNVNYDRDSKAIHLKGSVESAAVKQRAEQVATTAVGTTGNILNELTVEGTTGEKVADDLDGKIRTQLNDMVDADAVLKDRDVNFDVNNGAVEIKGSVASPAEKDQVGKMVRNVQGVKDMANGLEVRPDEYKGKKPVAATRKPAATTTNK
jgi:osmotically-inducible protein OsmY